MKKLKIALIGITSHIILSSSGGSPAPPPIWEQENVSFPMMNQEIKNALEEGDRQTNLLANQTITATEEGVNEIGWDRFQKKTKKINDRLRNIAKILNDIPTGIKIVESIKQTRKYQNEIVKEIKESPYLLGAGLPLIYSFADDTQMTIRFLAGVVLSYGSINQMEHFERKELMKYIVEEVTQLEINAYNYLTSLRGIKGIIELKKGTLKAWVSQDRAIINAILKDIGIEKINDKIPL